MSESRVVNVDLSVSSSRTEIPRELSTAERLAEIERLIEVSKGWTGWGTARQQVTEVHAPWLLAEVARLQAQVAAMQTVVDAARVLRQNVGSSNKHTATCQDSPCSTCEGLDELEADAGMELDMQLLNLDTSHV